MARTSRPRTIDWLRDETGQTLAEYGIIVGFLSAALIVVLATGALGGALDAHYLNVADIVAKAAP